LEVTFDKNEKESSESVEVIKKDSELQE